MVKEKVMVEYYGWINISDNEYESSEKEINRIITLIKEEINKFDLDNRILELKCINGNIVVTIAGAANHKSFDVVEILDFYRNVPKIAKGSYGLLFLLDDEGASPDTFQIFKIRKGEVIIEDDILLSPCSLNIFS